MTRSGSAVTAVGVLLDGTGKTDSEVAAALGIHSSLISRYRTGERRPSKRHADLLCRYFGCSLTELLGPAPDDTIDDTHLLEPESWID